MLSRSTFPGAPGANGQPPNPARAPSKMRIRSLSPTSILSISMARAIVHVPGKVYLSKHPSDRRNDALGPQRICKTDRVSERDRVGVPPFEPSHDRSNIHRPYLLSGAQS
jgi:hypothetical protein